MGGCIGVNRLLLLMIGPDIIEIGGLLTRHKFCFFRMLLIVGPDIIEIIGILTRDKLGFFRMKGSGKDFMGDNRFRVGLYWPRWIDIGWNVR